MPYNIYLADRGISGSNISDNLRNSVAATLLGWFNEIVRLTATPSIGVAVNWVANVPRILPNELLIFFVQSPSYSIVNQMPGVSGNNQTLSGLTGWSRGFTCSEVYIDHGTQFLSQMTFHEALHNKTHFGNSRLHNNYDGLARGTVTGVAPTDGNKTLMAAHLLSNKPQWVDGFSH
jgi:hypothetical protein